MGVKQQCTLAYKSEGVGTIKYVNKIKVFFSHVFYSASICKVSNSPLNFMYLHTMWDDPFGVSE